ncbi:RING finger protein 8 [Mycena kentingensis (nom. inval.)]|nr:RING finger protein 8 [Mycena kentingensis (nom. inval.)]
MKVAFTPDLGHTIRLPSPSTGTVQLHLTATVHDEDDWRVLVATQARVQLWSNIGNPAWCEADFQPAKNIQEPDCDFVLAEQTRQLVLTVKVAVGQEYSFTYRVVHDDGQIEWLGAYGSNGSILVETASAASLDDAWTPGSARGTMIREVARDGEVAKLARTDYAAVFSSPELLVLAPKPDALLQTPTLVFSATPSGSLSFNSSTGSVGLSGESQLTFTSCESLAELQNALTTAQSGAIRVASGFSDATIIISSRRPAHVAILPKSHPQKVEIPLSVLAAGAPYPLCLYSPGTQSARFYSADTKLRIVFGASDGALLLVPMVEVAHEGRRWYVGVASANSESTPADVLPTPPPSPRLRPVVNRAPASPDPSFLNLAAAQNIAVPEAGPPSAVSKPRPSMWALIGYIGFSMLGWVARVVFCWRWWRKTPRKALSAPGPVDERTPLLADERRQRQPTVQVESTPTRPRSIPGISTTVQQGKVVLLVRGGTPEKVPVLLDGNAEEKRVLKMKMDMYLVEFVARSAGRMTVGSRP